MEFRILGPLEVHSDGQALDLGGAKQRALLAVLLLHANQVVSRDRLADALWESDPPKTAQKALQNHVSALRKLLGEERLETRPPGYLLRVVDGELDVEHFRHLCEQGRLAEALALWRGAPLSDFASQHFAQAEIGRLEDERLACLEERIEGDLDAGGHAELAGELEALVAENPLRERLRAQLMLALYRSGRQAEALESYAEARRLLVEELGLEPGGALRELHAAILRQDPALEPAETQLRSPTPRFPLGRGALPAGLTRLVGRSDQVDEICARLRGEARILTLTGPGGIGKTRVAIEVAERLAPEYADGARFVALAPISDPELVVATIANSLGLRPAPGQALLEALVEGVRDAALLLVLDNYEHVLEAAPLASELAQSAAGLKIVATSRAPLHIRGEHVWPVPSLTVPQADADLDELESSSSVAVFVERARAAEPSFELTPSNARAVAEVCNRLDGLPLAIELAAARISILSATAMADRLDRALSLPVAGPRDAPARQQTLESAISWSYELLPENLRSIFRGLSIFSGGWTLEAVQAVCDAGVEAMRLLVESSLVRPHHAAEGRLTMLATIREYASDRLDEAGDREDRSRLHLEYFLAFAESLEPESLGENQAAALARLELEHDNLRQALAWALRTGNYELALRLGGALRVFWVVHGHFEEGRLWLEKVFEAPDASLDVLPPLVVAKATAGAARLSARLGRFADARLYGERSREIYRIHGDPADAAYALDTLAWVAQLDGDHDRAAMLLEEAIDLARRRGDQGREAVLLMNLGYVMLLREDDSSAETLFRRSAELSGARGNPYNVAMSLVNLGLIALKRGRVDDAEEPLLESLAAVHELGSEQITLYCIEGLAAVAAARGRTNDAAQLLGYAKEIQERLGTPLETYEQEMHDTTVSTVTDAHGPEEAARLIELGRGMTFDEAIALATPN